jgi:hypothetical protein
MISLGLMSTASHRGGMRRRKQLAAAVCACARTRGVAHRPASQAPAVLCNTARGSMRVPAYLDPLSRRATSAAVSGCGVQRQHAAGGDGSRPTDLCTANGYKDNDVEKTEEGTLPTDRLTASAAAASRPKCC